MTVKLNGDNKRKPVEKEKAQNAVGEQKRDPAPPMSGFSGENRFRTGL